VKTEKPILIVLTSHDRLGDTGEKTGFWAEEFAAPYYALVDAGLKVVLASPAGGQPPIDPKSELPDFQTPATRRLADDETTRARLADTIPLREVWAEDYAGVFYPGGHGPLWDLAHDPVSIALIRDFLAQGKPVAAVCHAPAVLLAVETPDGRPLVEGREVTGFSNAEEAAVGLTEVVPFLLEDELKRRGARYRKSEDWAPFCVTDGLLVTGQNPASSEPTARAFMERLGR